MKPKTVELLYLLFWGCDQLMHPTFRNLTGTFEEWAYRNGLGRRLEELERDHFLESQQTKNSMDRVVRLTESGRLVVLGGRDPESCWRRGWDRKWRTVLYDVPRSENAARNRLRFHLRSLGFGYLQGSVWISPDPFDDIRMVLAGTDVDVESLIVLESHPCGGETNSQIVEGAWDFAEVNRRYEAYLKLLGRRPDGSIVSRKDAERFREWASEEHTAWAYVMSKDPLLPSVLHPPDYLGPKAWQARVKALAEASIQIRSFTPQITHHQPVRRSSRRKTPSSGKVIRKKQSK